MNQILNRNLFFVKEHVGMFKAANNFDILDPESQQIIMTCREEKLGFLTKIARFTDYKRMTPFEIEVKTTSGEKVLTVKRGFSMFASTVEVLDETDQLIGVFKQSFFSFKGKFNIYDANQNSLATLKGSWRAYNFSFVKDGVELAKIDKKWAGLGKELFTSADNYMVQILEQVPQNDSLRTLVLAAVLSLLLAFAI